MELFIYKTLILALMVASSSSMRSSIRSSSTGCTRELDRSKCMFTYHCTGYITEANYNDFEMIDDTNYFNERCPSNIFTYYSNNYGHRSCNLINIAYKETNGQNTLSDSIFNDENFRRCAVSLDLSNNEYSICPILTSSVENLITLNLSRNSLSEAKLSNLFELTKMTEIDFSFNTINTIEVNSYEYPYKNLKKLNISHNYLAAIPDAVFDSFDELEKLDLSHNYIDTLHVLTFEGTKKLLVLNLSYNRITEINMSLLRFDKLMELDLSNNKIVVIKTSDFEKLVLLRKLDLSFNFIFNIQKNAFVNLNLVHTLDLRNNALETLDKDIFSNMSSLQNINLSNNNFKTLTKDLLRGKMIMVFSIKGNYLEASISKGAFEGLKLVTELDLSNQQLVSIDDFAFFGLEKLNLLLLNNNKIHLLSKNSFKGLQNLEILDLSSNHINNLEFETKDLVSLRSLLIQNNHLTQMKPEYLHGLNSLQFLDLSSNNISQLEPKSFKSLNDLINFQISNNPLSGALGEKTFDGLNILPSLDISGTLLTLVKNYSLSGMAHLKELNMSHSKVSEIQFNSFSNTGTIEILDLSFNILSDFNVNTTELTNLNTLMLNNNLLISLSSFSFKGLPRLNKIVISHNKIEIIQVEAFADQQDLRYLDLSFNPGLKFDVSQIEKSQFLSNLILSGIKTNITFIAARDITLSDLELCFAGVRNINLLELKKLKNLENLALNNNDVARVEVGAFSNLTRLKNLDLSHNKIEYIQPGAFKDNTVLHLLNISHNSLSTVSYGIFRGLVYLNTIDMSYNFIDNLKSERFYEVRSLSKLIVDHNMISSIVIDEFGDINLRTLSIGDNPLPCDTLVNMKKASISLTITAIRIDESSDENIDGITCNMRRSKAESESFSGKQENYKIFADIRDILRNLSFIRSSEVNTGKAINDSLFMPDVINKVIKSNDEFNTALFHLTNMTSNIIHANTNTNSNLDSIKTAIVKGNNGTSVLLEKMLNVLTMLSNNKTPTPVALPIPKENGTVESLIPYINKIKQDLEDSIALEKQNILQIKSSLLTEMETKISALNTSVKSSVSAPIVPNHDALLSTEKPEQKSFMFIEVCVGLMLVILVGFVLYTFYNSGMFIPKGRSYSTRNLPDAMENSTL